MTRLINPPKYEISLKGHAPCNYSLASRTLYRSLAIPEHMSHVNQIEAFYKYDYNDFKIDWAFRSFEDEDEPRIYNIIMVTDKGIFKDDMTRSVYDDKIYMRWTTFVSKLQPREPGLFITTMPGSKHITWFYPESYEVIKCGCKNKVRVKDTNGLYHCMEETPQLLNALRLKSEYIDIDTTNFIPVWNFNMWYQMF